MSDVVPPKFAVPGQQPQLSNTTDQPPQAARTGPTATDITSQSRQNSGEDQGKLPFKDQVIAYAKIHRGTLLHRPEEKELGKKILSGEAPPPSQGSNPEY